MPSCSSCEDPPSQLARAAAAARAPSIVCSTLHPCAPAPRAALEAWLKAVPVLQRRELTDRTRLRLEDARRLCEELARVLTGEEPGEGRPAERTLHVAVARGRVLALSSMFACPRGTFIELLVTAPWNVLGPDDPSDPRTVRGAGSALVWAAARWSWRRGCAGRVALQAENARALAFYEHLGFCGMRPEDLPLTLVPPGELGWSGSILRLARGRAGAEEARSPWLLLDPAG